MKKSEMMARLRKERASEAEKAGLVKIRVEEYVTPEQKERILRYIECIKSFRTTT